jgi:hypothetical protein
VADEVDVFVVVRNAEQAEAIRAELADSFDARPEITQKRRLDGGSPEWIIAAGVSVQAVRAFLDFLIRRWELERADRRIGHVTVAGTTVTLEDMRPEDVEPVMRAIRGRPPDGGD